MTKKRLAGGVAAVAIAIPTIAAASHQFDDVPDANIFHDDIEWMADNKITLGCDTDNFCPSDVVTREQMAAFMHRLSGEAAGFPRSVDADELDGYHATQLGLLRVTALPVRCDESTSTNFTGTFKKIGDIGTFTKEDARSTVLLDINTVVDFATVGTASGAKFEVRIDDENADDTAAGFHVAAAHVTDDQQVSAHGVWRDLDAGEHTVSMWVRGGANGTGTGARFDPGCWRDGQVTIEEEMVFNPFIFIPPVIPPILLPLSVEGAPTP